MHRNIANVITTNDLNSLAVIEYAVVHLKVSHVVLAGHTSCGGCAAALSEASVGSVLDAWLTPLKVVRRENKKELDAITEDYARTVRLAELNVAKGVSNIMANSVVERAIAERGLQVHGAIYELGSGKLRDLAYGTDKPRAADGQEDLLEPSELGLQPKADGTGNEPAAAAATTAPAPAEEKAAPAQSAPAPAASESAPAPAPAQEQLPTVGDART